MPSMLDSSLQSTSQAQDCVEWYHSPLHKSYLGFVREQQSASDAQNGEQILVNVLEASHVLELREMVCSLSNLSAMYKHDRQKRLQRLQVLVGTCWNELLIPEDSRENCDTQAAASEQGVQVIINHIKELLEYRDWTVHILHNLHKHDQLLGQALGEGIVFADDDPRVGQMDKLQSELVDKITAWGRRFNHLAVHAGSSLPRLGASSSSPKLPSQTQQRAAFVWFGQDAVERIHCDSTRVRSGKLPSLWMAPLDSAPGGGLDENLLDV